MKLAPAQIIYQAHKIYAARQHAERLARRTVWLDYDLTTPEQRAELRRKGLDVREMEKRTR